ncbi:hypothetical protein FJV41_19795 [Myxococcus llanfairpwllgwyngyllgogerychwyrndrobwllllantysiliogogogochensis]|uniref:Uncharacterized protein n=1 Tax=Myxococcus llanfairpwllgwyngyllgogerychwyrndrobwllllantysiliogogogochensis TaxID=2590453 RepID=A0A540X0G3_9BACT|nr:hypothetical protein [Myxococcus llanfairpwllgwyngyllgogerychwyrndrobwllllantysiliogogogochensis]TQF14214.1 hypothetical protein FJV41_19795 [Myxococcus llanfairpwllgwyngyllgogerychwyrndrobwllllantysiliogogogochensis]
MNDWYRREALAQRLGAAEREMQAVVAARDGSPEWRTRYVRAKAEYRMAEAAALAELGPRDALALVENQHAADAEVG